VFITCYLCVALAIAEQETMYGHHSGRTVSQLTRTTTHKLSHFAIFLEDFDFLFSFNHSDFINRFGFEQMLKS
jgi:hypothetical protein